MKLNLRKLRYALIAYALFDLYIGGTCGGIFPLAQLAAAQFTTVTGTVLDPNNNPYALGTITPLLVIPSGAGSPTLNGLPYTPPTSSIGLDKNGTFSFNVADNTQLLPASTKWTFQICSALGTVQPAGGKGPICFTVPALTVSGATQSITAAINAVPPPAISSSGGGAGGFGPAQNTFQVQTTSCGSNPNCVQINGDARTVLDASTNSTNTITCPNNDCNFVAADAGKSIQAVQQGGPYSFTGPGTLLCGNSVPLPTISTVNSAQSITITGAACTGTSAGNVMISWGHKDGATLRAANFGCLPIYVSAGISIMLDDAFANVVPTCATTGITQATGVPQPSLYVAGTSTTWIVTADFNYGHCTGLGAVSGQVCVGAGLTQMWNFVAWGMGASNGSTTNCANSNSHTFIATNPAGGALYFVNLSGVCPGSTLTGAELNSLDDEWQEGGVQQTGSTEIAVSRVAVNIQSLDDVALGFPGGSNTNIGLKVFAAGQVTDWGSYAQACIDNFGNYYGRSAHLVSGNASGFPCQAAIQTENGATTLHDGDFINTDSAAVAGSGTGVGTRVVAGGVETFANTKILTGSAPNVAVSNSGQVLDHGGNSLVGATAVFQTFQNGVFGDQVFTGTARGTCTSSSTLGFYQFGENTSPNCTSATTNLGTVMQRAGTIINMSVHCGTAGFAAGSGVTTLLKNGAALGTSVTCTLGTTTDCQDFTHNTNTVAVGDVLSAQIVTVATETLANCGIAVVVW